ncbi:WAT1-related protein At1g25270-like [Euphorbia lathyris]|uniref:WAT1-related protein At1g25270-like n=1 Tax=Euphorbia lathyris TaxID=212925 RepID=UPI0033139A03
MGRIGEVLHGLKPVILMILAQMIWAGMNILDKLAANDDISMRVLVAYRWIIASAFSVPLALVFDRKNRPKFTWKVLLFGFLTSLFGGFLTQNLMAESLVLTSATYVSAIINLVSCFTLIFSAILGIEKLGLKTRAGKAKVSGMLIGISGTIIITFYKGVELKIWSTNIHLLKPNNKMQKANHQILGCFVAFCSSITYSLWLIVQGKLSKIYPRHYTTTALMSLMSSVQCVIFALCVERDWSQWKLGWNFKLLVIFYAGIMTSVLMMVFIAMSLTMRGPVFVSSFNPLTLLLTAIASSLILQEMLHLGSILGGALIVIGLYVALWGQSKETKEKSNFVPIENELIEVVSDTDICIPQASSSKELLKGTAKFPKELM